jgi:hypothetical protein
MKTIGHYIHWEERAHPLHLYREREVLPIGDTSSNVIYVLGALKDILVTLIMLLSIGCDM